MTALGALLCIVFVVAAMAGSVRGIVAVLVVVVLLSSPIAVLALVLASGLFYLYLKH